MTLRDEVLEEFLDAQAPVADLARRYGSKGHRPQKDPPPRTRLEKLAHVLLAPRFRQREVERPYGPRLVCTVLQRPDDGECYRCSSPATERVRILGGTRSACSRHAEWIRKVQRARLGQL